jgi:CheY-like chemotaxis protein
MSSRVSIPESTQTGAKGSCPDKVAQVAHDLRNVITGLLGTASLLRDTPDLPHDLAFGLAAIEKAALHARDLSLQLGTKSETPQPMPQLLEIETEHESVPTPAPASSARILAMDDEPGIRALLLAALSHFGYDAVAVADGAEALAEYKRAISEHQPYSAVIIDLNVPGGMGGKDAIKALKEIDPNVRAILSSGGSSDPVATEFSKHGFIARADKPYRIQELGAILENALRN